MKCPYAVNRSIVTQTEIEYEKEEETFLESNSTVSQINTAWFVDCLEDDCGAFYDGRCHYNGN